MAGKRWKQTVTEAPKSKQATTAWGGGLQKGQKASSSLVQKTKSQEKLQNMVRHGTGWKL